MLNEPIQGTENISCIAPRPWANRGTLAARTAGQRHPNGERNTISVTKSENCRTP